MSLKYVKDTCSERHFLLCFKVYVLINTFTYPCLQKKIFLYMVYKVYCLLLYYDENNLID